MNELVKLPIIQISPHPDNPRKDLGDLTELADSIKVNGIMQNLTVVPKLNDDGNWAYTVVIGHRRLAAAKLAGLSEVPCVVVKMTDAEQIKTMLMENMQRSDLTVYEQAQGFQMMLDMGGTISTVAADTGFSETTIRRRVKLLELDPKEFQKSQERGATLFDYMELDKVEDIKEKNKLLKIIGTPDFGAKLQKAVDAQKKAARLEAIQQFLSSFATKVEKVDSGLNEPYTYMSCYDFWSDKLMETPADADTREYVYTLSSYGASLYRKKTQEDYDKIAQREAEYKESSDRRAARANAVKEVSDRCYKLRKDFVMGLSSTACKKMAKTALAAMMVSVYDGFGQINEDDMADLGITVPEEEELTIDAVIAAVSSADQGIVRLAYLLMEGRGGYFKNWGDYPYDENEGLDLCYEFLEKLGYEMSDEEKAFQNGTHEIFQNGG